MPQILERKDYLINKLFDLDDRYLNYPLYTFSLVELERIHIKELNKTKHINNWKNKKTRKELQLNTSYE